MATITNIVTESRPIDADSLGATLAGGVFKVFLAAFALGLPWVDVWPAPLSVGGMLLAGGLVELAVGWKARHNIVGMVALGSGAMTMVTGLIFLVAVGMGLAQLTLLTTAWLMLRVFIFFLVALRWRPTGPARVLLWVRGATDLALGVALVAGLSISQLALVVFGSTLPLASGFLAIVAVSFGVAGGGLIGIALLDWRRHADALAPQ